MVDMKTKDVEVLLGHPKKAVIAMSIPIVIALAVQNINNLIDTFWVSGISADALAAVGIVFPLYFILISIGNGIGVGASSAISRFIGRGEKENADRVAAQALRMTVIASVVIGIVLVLSQSWFFELMGAGDATEACAQYGAPIFMCAPILLLNSVLANILRSEGASKRSMYSQILSAVINVVLDPIFIFDYGLGLGVMGAAWATVISILVSLLLQTYWFFFTDSTYLKIKPEHLRHFDMKFDKDIARVGFPASMEMMLISVGSAVCNSIIIIAAGTDGVAAYSTTWKVIQIIMIPMMGMGSAIVPVCAAAFGLHILRNIRTAYIYSILTIVTVTVAICSMVFLGADLIASLFARESSVELKDELIFGLRVGSLYVWLASWGFVTSGMFQSIGMANKSLACSVLRNSLKLPVCFAIVMTVGTFESFWYGLAISEIVGTAITGIWGAFTLRTLLEKDDGTQATDVEAL